MTYYVRQESKEMYTDSRMRPGGIPLRKSQACPCLIPPFVSKSDKAAYLYEAQASIVIIGIDHSTWTAYGTADTYFDSKTRHNSRPRGFKGPWDPLPGGVTLDMNIPIWDPREYFLTVVEARISGIVKEWSWNIGGMEDAIELRFVSCILPFRPLLCLPPSFELALLPFENITQDYTSQRAPCLSCLICPTTDENVF